MVSDELVKKLKAGASRLLEEGLKAVVLGAPSLHIAGSLPLPAGLGKPYVFIDDDQMWSVLVSGPRQMSTVVSVSEDPDIGVDALIAFSRLERRSDPSRRRMQKMIWDIQRAGFWCVVRGDGLIEVSTVEVEPMEYPDDFMVVAYRREKKFPMATIDFADGHWAVVVEFDQDQQNSRRLECSSVEDVAPRVVAALTAGRGWRKDE
ncbi:MAG: hypothetical protein IPK19_28965 [Chloroflexi bacterium]|nr:hypothetical protein [Chloroflexota bacterium]